MGHAGAADGFHQGLLNDAVLDVQRQLAGTLLGSAPADAVGQAADVGDLLGQMCIRDRSEAVIRGVWTYTKPRSWKNSCTAMAATERTRNTAENRFVRGRRWAMVRRYSTVWRFFCRG